MNAMQEVLPLLLMLHSTTQVGKTHITECGTQTMAIMEVKQVLIVPFLMKQRPIHIVFLTISTIANKQQKTM